MGHYLAPLILLPHSDPPLDAPGGKIFWFKVKYVQIDLLFDLASDHSCCQPSTTIVTLRVVNCYKPSATVGTCCSQSSSVMLTTPKSMQQEARQLLFAVRCSYLQCVPLCFTRTSAVAERPRDT